MLSLSVLAQTPIADRSKKQKTEQVCIELLDWLYKDLTLQNLDKSLERLKTKLFMGMLTTLNNNKVGYMKSRPKLLKLWKSLKKLDPEFEQYLNKNAPFTRYRFWRNRNYNKIKTVNFFDIVKQWKDLQSKNPEYFYGLEKEYLLDDWDLHTADLIENISDVKYENTAIKENITEISLALKDASNNINKKLISDDTLLTLKSKIDNAQQEIYKNATDLYLDYLKDYGHVCDSKLLANLDKTPLVNELCSFENANHRPDVTNLLISLADVITLKEMNTIDRPSIPEKKDVLVENNEDEDQSEENSLDIVELDYDVNPNPKAYYCTRDPNVIDTITIHHTGEPKETTPEQINTAHIARSTDGDPWFMIGYNYLISETAHGGTEQNPAIIQGRAPEVRGAHAGGYTRVLSDERKKELSKYDIKCGRDETWTQKNMSTEFKDNKISGNITTIGVAILGNYETSYSISAGGVVILKNAKGGKKITYPSEYVLRKTADLACHLQKKYPNIKRIVPHRYFKATNCPGSIINRLQVITNYANELGCNFNKPEFKQ